MNHGTETAYNKGCRCDECRWGRTRRGKQRARELRGQKALVDATPAWEHARMLIAEGWPVVTIARAAQIQPRSLNLFRPTIHRESAARILALTRLDLHQSAPDMALVPAIGAVRRYQALQAIGWPYRDLFAGNQWMPNNTLRALSRGSMSAGTWRRVADVYDRLSLTPGPSKRTRASAARHGWLPPLCWEDETIDDPNAEPAARRRRPADTPAGRHADRLDFVAEHPGHADIWIAERLRINVRTVHYLRTELAQGKLENAG